MIKRIILSTIVLLVAVIGIAPEKVVAADNESEIISMRTETSKTYELDNGRKRLEVYVSPIHYKNNYQDDNEIWKDIDLTIVNNQITKAPYTLTIDHDTYTMVDKKTGDSVAITGEGELEAFGTGIRLKRTLNTSLDISSIANKDFLITQHGTSISVSANARDANGKVIPVNYSIKDGVLSEKIDSKDLVDVEYPITIDPTVEVSVSTNTDDCLVYWNGSAWAMTNFSELRAGWDSALGTGLGAGMRFQSITIPQGASINTAYITFTAAGSTVNVICNTRITGENVDDASTWSTVANYQSRRGTVVGGANDNNITVAQVDWDALPSWSLGTTYDSPSIVSIIQEIIDRPGWISGNDLALWWDDHDMRSTANYARRRAASHENTSYDPSKLTIVYYTSPTITINEASSVTSSTARLNSVVVEDGGEDCQVRWGYGTTSQIADFDSYDTVSDWSVAEWSTGEHPYLDIEGLDGNETYYFGVQIKNSYGTANSTELNFTTEEGFEVPTRFRGIPSDDSITLSWIKGAGSPETYIRFRVDTYPTTTDDGTLVYNDDGNSYEHTGRTAGQTYYYSAWGKSGTDNYTEDYVTLAVTTYAYGVIEGEDFETPDTFADWFLEPNYLVLSGIEPIYSAVNGVADAKGIPRNTVWVVLYLLIVSIMSIALMSTNGVLAGAIISTLLILVGVSIGLLPGYMVFMAVLVTIGVWSMKQGESV